MDKDTLLSSLAGTLDTSADVRKHSEEQLHYYENMPGFTAYLLELVSDPSLSFGIQTSAAIFFKNRVVNYWIVPEHRAVTERYIRDEEKGTIKSQLIEVLAKTYKNVHLRVQLSTAVSSILDHDKWDELTDMIPQLLCDANVDHVYTGLICLYEYTKNYRYAGIDRADGRNIVLDNITESVFPVLERLAPSLLADGSAVSDEMLYLIMKIFKFATFISLPAYLQQQETLGVWCTIHLNVINAPLPAAVALADQDEKCLSPRVKAVKWCFANMHRLLMRHGGGVSTRDKNNAFATMFLGSFVPEILNAYWRIIEQWSTNSMWLSPASLYHLISFLEQLIETPSYNLVEERLDAIVQHVVLPTLNATSATIELYEEEPDEYIRRFFDTSRENSTADTACVNFLFRLVSIKFDSCIALLLRILNNTFQRRAADRSNLQGAIETEGALRMLATISYKLNKKSSPMYGQVDQLMYLVVYPELSPDVIAKTPWLTARACDTIAIFMHKFTDESIRQHVFHAVVYCFQQQGHFPIQLTAIDALRALVEDDAVAAQVAEQAPQLMSTLLDMSKTFESDILTSVMDVFVEKFSDKLEPYANELTVRLVEQFMRAAHEILDQTLNNGAADIDKEYQASGILSTLTTLVLLMGASPQVLARLEEHLRDLINFVLENAMELFLGEVLEMLELLVFSAGAVSPVIWDIFQTCVGCFDTYASDYFDMFHPFFEAVVVAAFSTLSAQDPRVQAMFTVCFGILSGDKVDPVFAHHAFELLEFSVLALGPNFVEYMPQFLSQIFTVFTALEAQDAFDGYMLHHLSVVRIFLACLYVDAADTLRFVREKSFTALFSLWIKHSTDFQSVYGCKLQILAATAIVCDAPADVLPLEDLVGELVDLLISTMETLPHAIKARQELMDRDSKARDYDEDEEENYDDDFEADEAELEALKQTPIDKVNAFMVFAERVSMLQQRDPARYNVVFGGLDAAQKQIAQRIISIVHGQS